MNEPVSLLPGYIVTERVRCGKPNCRCARGELHGPYHYRRWHSDGTHHKAYVRPQDLDRTQAALRAWSDLHKDVCESRRRSAEARDATRWLLQRAYDEMEERWNR